MLSDGHLERAYYELVGLVMPIAFDMDYMFTQASILQLMFGYRKMLFIDVFIHQVHNKDFFPIGTKQPGKFIFFPQNVIKVLFLNTQRG